MDSANSRIDQYLAEHGLISAVTTVLPLTGDASDRRYFRVLLKDGESIVLALHAGAIDFEGMPFVSVARLLAAVPLPVPRILHHSNALGVIALQDLGDVTLQAHLGAATHAEHSALYREAVSFIAQLQLRGELLTSDDYPCYRSAFDIEKLTWELEFFVNHFLVAYRGLDVSPALRAVLAEEWAEIAEELASDERVLCHRDFHSRNLMLHGGSLFIIDFQDARMGPDTYDLVSLLRDSYVDLGARQVEELTAYFLSLRYGERTLTAQVAAEFARRFDLMALQRNLKALGTFGYQTVARGNSVYIQYIPRTLNYVRGNLARYSRFARLREALAELVDELH